MGTIDVGIGHDDEFPVAQFLGVEGALILFLVADPGPESTNHALDLLVREDLGQIALLPLDIENLAAQW